MKQKAIKYVSMLLLLAAAYLPSYGQYMNKLYDYDHTGDWGWNIFFNPDSSYFVIGYALDPITDKWSMTSMEFSADGNTMTDKKRIQFPNASVYIGNPGEARKLVKGGYILPFTIQWPNPVTNYLYSGAQLIKLDATGDTVFLKTYTDTSIYYDVLNTCAVMPDGGYMVGGGHALNTSSIYPGLIVRTDSMGDTLWTHTYQKNSWEWVEINTIAPTDNGKILAGAFSAHQVALASSFSYYHEAPWFMILDSMGNIVKDTVYSIGFQAGGRVYKDMNGGYIHIGRYDSLFTPYPDDIVNFPGYIAHLDTNFRVTWIREFNYSTIYGHREPWGLHQLRDSSYIVYGDGWPPPPYGPASVGWAAKIDRSGNIVWSRSYPTDTAYDVDSYIRDMVEKADGSLVFIGAGFNDSLPSWHQGRDVWLLGVDSNGCEIAGCSPTKIASPRPSPGEREVLRVWPNPAAGTITVMVSAAGQLDVYNIQGQLAAAYKVKKGSTDLRLPASMAGGVYIVAFTDENGVRNVMKLLVQ